MNFVRKIFSYLLAVIFLISAAGFNYTKYTCVESGNVQFVLDKAYTNCNVEQETCCKEEPVCFTIDKKDCCVNETNYLKTDEDYTAPERTKLLKIEIHHLLAYQYAELFPELPLATKEIAHSPPFIIYSKDILLRHGVLLI